MTDTTVNNNTTGATGNTEDGQAQGNLQNTALGKTAGSAEDLQIFQAEMIVIQTKMSISNSYFNSMLAIMDKASKSSLR